MNIECLGERIIHQLYEADLVESVADLYRLERAKLLRLERMGEKSVHNLLTSIDASRDNSLERHIFGFGIRHIEAKAARKLAMHFHTIDALLEASNEEKID